MDEKAGLQTGCCTLPGYRRALSTRDRRRPAMKRVSTAATKKSRNFSEQKLTIGLDLGARSSHYCVLDETGGILVESKISTSNVLS
jgi:Ethanolamine utilization protein EutJ (predicted chaperonin)